MELRQTHIICCTLYPDDEVNYKCHSNEFEETKHIWLRLQSKCIHVYI